MYSKNIRVYVCVFICSLLTFTSIFLFLKTNRFKQELSRLSKINRSKTNLIKYLRNNNYKFKTLQKNLVIEKKLEAIRGLRLKKVLNYDCIDRKKLLEIIMGKFREQYPNDSFDKMENAYKTIGLLEESTDLKKAVLDTYKEQVAAFYDYRAKKIYTVKNIAMTPNIKDLFLSHEMTHAIQDQHYDLIKMGIDNKENEDRLNALTSLLEGDATYCMNKYYQENAGIGIFLDLIADQISALIPKKLDTAPQFLKRTLLFPYINGLAFVSEIHNKNFSMNQVFIDPPTTTEQIIHPEKYFVNRDRPDYPTIPDISDILEQCGYKITYKNTLGEFFIQILLESELSRQDTVKASSGWDGDRYIVFENDNKNRGFIMVSRWDTVNDASEFHKTYLKWLSQRFSLPTKTRSKEDLFVVNENHQYYSFLKDKDCIIVRTDRRTIEKIKDSLLNR